MSGYIGTQPVPQATQTRDSFTATSGQTSFATGGYTPNFLDIFLNGVKLSAADYTASNGSDVVLASGAATGDILEVVAFTTFNSASSSIDDNGNATAITIDSDENVGIGVVPKTWNVYDQAVQIGDGAAIWTYQNAEAHYSVNSYYNSGNKYISTGAALQYEQAAGVHSFKTATSGTADAAISWNTKVNIDSDGLKFNGDTAAANALNDFETGTFTPVVAGGSSAGTASYSTQSGSYTKVGNLVTVWIRLNYTSGNGSGSLQVKGFPFTVVTTNIPTFVVYTVGITAPSTVLPAGFCNLSNGIQLVENQTGGNSGPTLAYDGSGEIVITGTYPTND